MSYDIELVDRTTGDVIQLPTKHLMTGGTFRAEYNPETDTFSPLPISDAWLNITYNYAHYYYEATEGDERFGESGGIRGIYGKTGAESIALLDTMITRITDKYTKDGEWITTTRIKSRYYDSNGTEISENEYRDAIFDCMAKNYTAKDYKAEISEGYTDDYWEPTAANAIKPLWQLRAMASLRPDGVWTGD